MRGTIKKLVDGKQFGFIRGDDDMEYFFHATACGNAGAFAALTVGDGVEFTVEPSTKGPRATDVRRG